MSQFDKDIKNEELDVNESVEESKEAAATKKHGSFSVGLIEQIELIVIMFAVIVLMFSFVFRTCRVNGPSMENTLFDKETVVVCDLFYEPKKNDIIVFHQTGELNEPIVKRVIGLPGDTVNIKHSYTSMTVTVTDKDGNVTVLEEPYAKYEGLRLWMRDSSTYVEEGTVFVLGDNRSNSADSRDSRIGLVDTRRIMGKVVFRVTPISRMGTVK